MACTFCATGQAGFTRHLTTGEIVEQVVAAVRAGPAPAAVQRRLHGHGRAAGQLRPGVGGGRAAPRRPRAVGPPPDRVDGGGGAGHPPPGRRGRCRSTWPCRSTPPTTSCATELVPAQPALPARPPWPRPAATTWTATGRRLSFEWALIDGVNDRPADAAELADFARPLGAHVNLIPLNPTPGLPGAGHPARPGSGAFRDELAEPRGQRHRPGHPGHRDRRRLRPAGRPEPTTLTRRRRPGTAHSWPAPPAPIILWRAG